MTVVGAGYVREVVLCVGVLLQTEQGKVRLWWRLRLVWLVVVGELVIGGGCCCCGLWVLVVMCVVVMRKLGGCYGGDW